MALPNYNNETMFDKAVRFINRAAVYKRLRAQCSFLLSGRKINFKLVMNSGSYTDAKELVVGVPVEMTELSEEELYGALEALNGHECQHVLSSNFNQLKKYMDRLKSFFMKEDVAGRISDKISHSVANILEDGRIENILSKKYPGLKPKVLFLRLFYWNRSSCEGLDDMSAYMSTMLSLSVLGIYPQGYDEHASDEVKSEIRKIKPLIMNAIQARKAKECLMIAEEIITVHSKEFLLKHIKDANKQLEAYEKMAQMLEEFLKDQHENSEEVETQDSGGIEIHIKMPKKDDSKGSSSGSSDEDEDKKKNKEKSNGIKSKDEDKDKDDKDSKGSASGSKDKDSDAYKDGSESSKGEAKDSQPSGEVDTTNDSDDSNAGDGDKGEDGESQKNNNNIQLSQGSADGYEDEAQDESDFKEMLEKMRKEVSEMTKDDVSRSKQEERDKSSDVDYTLTASEINAAIGNQRYGEVANDFQLTESLPPEVKVMANKFRRAIENIFKNKVRARLNGQEEGLLNPDDLYKVSMKNYNVFQKEGRKSTSDHVAFILQDGSGSMHGEKERCSAFALSVIEEGLRDVIPYKMVTFNTTHLGVTHHVVKNWNDRSKSNYSINFLKHRRAGGGNHDDISIAIATKELLKRPERDRILIVLSDGLPSSIERTRDAIKYARKEGVHVVGIMFGDERFRKENFENYKQMYQQNIIATAPNMISSKLATVLKEILAR